MDKFQAQMITDKVTKAINEALAADGLACRINGGSYTPDSFTPRITIFHKQSDGTFCTPELQALRRRHPSMVGKLYWHPTYGVIGLTGIKVGATKYPYLFKVEATGKTYKTDAGILQYCIPAREAQPKKVTA